MRCRQEPEEGAVVILVAVLMVALLTFVALVVDLGGLQSAADGAALAGAQELIYSSGSLLDSEIIGQEYALDNIAANNFLGTLAPWNGSYSSSTSSVVADSAGVTVDLLETDVPYFFAPVIGQLTGSVRAHARAEVKYISGVGSGFPVTIMYMDPENFRFVFSRGKSELGSFDLTDPDDDGVFDTGNGAFTPSAGVPYDVTLQALDLNGDVALELENIGLWWIGDPSSASSKLYRVGMSREGGQLRVEAVVAPTVTADPSLDTLQATLGKDNFTLSDPENDGTYVGWVNPPGYGGGNDGYDLYDLEIDKLTGKTAVARYIAFAADVPIEDVMMTPGFYDGYSSQDGVTSYPGARIEVDLLAFGDYMTMKLGNDKTGGLYTGNWRLVDLYAGENAMSEIGTVPIPDDWELNHELVVGGPLDPQTGAAVGHITQGLSDRFSGHDPVFTQAELTSGGLTLEEMRDRWAGSVYGSAYNDPYFVIIPITYYSTDLTGTSEHYTISGFAAFYITDWSKKGDVGGVFIHWVTTGEWQDEPPGPIYVKTVVMVE
jgi:hypothetical protein